MKLSKQCKKITITKKEKKQIQKTVRKRFVQNELKSFSEKSKEKEENALNDIGEGIAFSMLGLETGKNTLRFGKETVKTGKNIIGTGYITAKMVIEYLKRHDKRNPAEAILKDIPESDQQRFAEQIAKDINLHEQAKEGYKRNSLGGSLKRSESSGTRSAQQTMKIVSTNANYKKQDSILNKVKDRYSGIRSRVDNRIEKKVLKSAKQIKRRAVYSRRKNSLQFFKHLLLMGQGNEGEGTEAVKSAGKLIATPIFAKVQIKLLALAGSLLMPLLPVIILFILLAGAFSYFGGQNESAGLSPEVEAYRTMVTKYCVKYKIPEYVDLALACMQQESGGQEPDPLQAGEGAYGLYCLQTKNTHGGHTQGPNGIPRGHAECSVNAGIQELRDAIKKAKVESPYDIGRIEVAVQGYNYGMDRWIQWINKRGGIYTLALSQEYSATMMPTGAKGTPNHALLVMQYYPLTGVGGSTTVSGNGGVSVIYYSQGDPRWGSVNFGGNTIAKAGCGPTSMAICVSTLGKKVTPVETCKWAAKHGYYVKGSGWSHSVVQGLAKHYKLKCTPIGKSKKSLQNALKAKKLVVAIMAPGHFTRGGHYIVLRGMTKKGQILVADCGNKERNHAWDFDIVFNEARSNASAGGPFWVIEK